MDGNTPICYHSEPIESFLDPNPQFKFYELIPDLAVGKVTENHKCGIISFRMSINDKTINGPVDFKKHLAWKKDLPKRPDLKKVRAYIF
jgi:hypothetical protein